MYWVSERIRNIFEELPGLKDVAKPKQGLATGKNERFVRYIWEVRNSNIGFNYQSCQQTKDGRKKWFPYMKGGGYRKWYGNQTYLVNWKNDGKEIRNFTNKVGNVLSRPQNTSLYFEEGVTWSDLSSRGFGVRYLPPGFVFDVKGSSGFPQRQFILTVMAIMNSTWMGYALGLLNPTVSFQVGDISRVPVALPQKNEKAIIDTWTRTAVRIRMVEAKRDELTFEFISPWNFGQGLAQFQVSQERLAYVETRINEEVYRLYGISDEDRAAIEAELRGELLAADDKDAVLQDDETDETEVPLSHQELAVRWVSYAVGVVLGRFVPGGDGRPETGESASAISRRPSALGCAVYRREDFAIGSLPAPEEDEFNELVGPPESFAYLDESGGRHIFPREVEEALRALAVPDGITVLDEGHPRDLPALVERALVLMLGENQAAEVVALAAGLATEDQLTGYLSRHPQLDSAALRKFLSKDFFTQWHVKWYKKRPVYWPIQSQNRGYGFVIFHEKISRDTFFAIQRDPYLDSKRRAVGYQLEELEAQLRAAQGRARKALEKQLAQARKLAEELTAFAQTLERITLGADGLPGYTPAENWIDDGIILRMAPLWEVIPIWKSEPKKYWQRLQNGDYDWSHIAMHYWPERCLEKCKTNKSFAIAHGVEEIYEGG
ncbi:hypothetical protein D6779_10675 [Candidatus Parcubacteria bacterium]|nr:MAG: hypothetical protein D6779_10675 [Candidatus Parcubacteria bacterium]